MDRIIYETGGKAPCVALTINDQQQIKAALKGLSVTKFSRTLGVTRTHFYSIINANTIELLRFCEICAILNLRLLSESDVNAFMAYLDFMTARATT